MTILSTGGLSLAGLHSTTEVRADAHSTAWVSGDTLTVDAGYGRLTVRRWTG
ncbi:hypothetical protein [Streptomyces pacificus]|uniref:Uncharacterized protein n=1 Tax=Streptomyces pacificus TaxID=2705029 RepID=A0A6A0AUP1_9ACTN|nr:hypothetical protein [Streptomyces pacificus]GFH36642.1 hypothetical protein SCWH03_28730 [Streptomyces pacificus]